MATREFTSSAPAPVQPASPQPATPAQAAPATRRLRVSSQSTCPHLCLKGRWLEQAGFGIGADVQVSVTPQRLVIEALGTGKPPADPALNAALARLRARRAARST